jgi:hypothetical protein
MQISKTFLTVLGASIAVMGAWGASPVQAGSATDAIRHTSEAVIRILSDEDLKHPSRTEERRQQLV